MYSRVITQTEQANQETLRLTLRSNGNETSAPRSVQPGRASLNYIPLDSVEEQYIASRIEIFRSQGASEQSMNLIMAMLSGGTLSADTQMKVKDWIKQYFELVPSDTESLSLAIAILIIKILRPALEKEGEEEQNLLMDWEEAGKDVLFLFLVDEQVDTFLAECEEQLDQKDILKSICAVADVALEKINQTFQDLFSRNDQQINQAYETFKTKLLALQENREQGCNAIMADMNCLIEDIEQLAESVMLTAIEDSEDLCKKLDAIQIASDEQFEEMKSVVRKI